MKADGQLTDGLGSNKMAQGIVKWFNSAKGFGFIYYKDKDYFVHYKQIQGEGFKTLIDGQTVDFIPEYSEKGPYATNVIAHKEE